MRLRSIGVNKDPGKENDLDESPQTRIQKLDVLDDPVRMYLKQMGQVPLLTRDAGGQYLQANRAKLKAACTRIINRFGFIAGSLPRSGLDKPPPLARNASTA